MGFAEFVDNDALLAYLHKECKSSLEKAAEPAIQTAMVDIEKALREQIGCIVISLLERSFSVEKFQDNLVITVLHKESK